MAWIPWWRRSADARVADDIDSDARPLVDHPRHAEIDPEAERRRRRNRGWTLLGGVVVFVVGLVTLLLGKGGVMDARRLDQERIRLESEVLEQRERVRLVEQSVEGLETNTLPRERIAREQLGYSRPGEVTFVFTDETLPNDPLRSPESP